MNNNVLQRLLRLPPALMLSHFLFLREPARLRAYGLCLVTLLPSLTFAAYLLTQLHARELNVLHQSAESRAQLAASYFDERMASLVSNLKELTGTPAQASENVYNQVRSELSRNGITVLNRAANLDLLSPTSGADAAIVALDASARSAAAAAIATLAPQITPYGVAAKGGVNIWIASTTDKNAPPLLLQARIPSEYLAATLKNFVSDGPWSISLVGDNGQIYAAANGKPINAAYSEPSDSNSLVEAFANTSQFGWKISAGVQSRSLELHNRRNWMTFAAISSLLAVASFAGATLLTRSLIEESNLNLAQAPRMPSSFDRSSRIKKGVASPTASDDRMRTALKAGNVGVWEWDLRSGAVHWDAEIAQIFGPALHGDQVARRLLRLVEPSDRRRLLNAIAAARANNAPLAVEVRVRRPDGESRWVAVRGAATEVVRGKASMSGVAYDITDRKLSLTRTDALLREVSHRSKNLLALILAMARLTARDAVDVKSHLKDFTLRVAGLAASQDLIVASDWQCVDLSTLASAEIGAVARTDAERILVSGPPVSLTPEAAQSFGMVLTELALNAVEHGALSSAKGEVRLSWSFPNADTIQIVWNETGGPQFPLNGPKGYGRSVIERFSTQGLKLSVDAVTTDDGLKWTLTGPLANIGVRGGRESEPTI